MSFSQYRRILITDDESGVPTMIEATRLARSHRYPASYIRTAGDSNDEPLQSEMR
jgi:hypothetical protein